MPKKDKRRRVRMVLVDGPINPGVEFTRDYEEGEELRLPYMWEVLTYRFDCKKDNTYYFRLADK